MEVWQKRNLTKIILNVLVHLKTAEWMEEYSKVELLNYLQIFVISNVLLFFSKRTTFDIKTLHIKTYFYLKYNFVTYLFQTNFSTEKPFVTWQKFLILSLTKTFLSLLKSQKMGGKSFSEDQLKIMIRDLFQIWAKIFLIPWSHTVFSKVCNGVFRKPSQLSNIELFCKNN